MDVRPMKRDAGCADVLIFCSSLKLGAMESSAVLNSSQSSWWADIQRDWLPYSLCFSLIAVGFPFVDTPSWSVCCISLCLHCSPCWGISLPAIGLPSDSIATKPGGMSVVNMPRWQRVPKVKLGTVLHPPQFHTILLTKPSFPFISSPTLFSHKHILNTKAPWYICGKTTSTC